MRAIAVSVLLVSVALAGCSGNNSLAEIYNCKFTGQKVDLAKVNGSAAKDFDKESVCPQPVQPSVVFTPPTTVMQYHPVTFKWSILEGNYSKGHTMLSSIRLSHMSMPVTNATKMADYGVEIGKVAHQDLPAAASATYSFEMVPATVYLRAYATILTNELAEKDYWSPEYAFTITPVVATGNSTNVLHELGAEGAVAGKLDPKGPITLKLGDSVIFQNSDVVQHKFTFASAPTACKLDPITVAGTQSASVPVSSPPVPLLCPGNFQVKTDDVNAQTLDIGVSHP